jgi:ribose 5-phosphate isomerase B
MVINMKKIVIGSDKSGFILKETLKTWLVSEGYEVSDLGTQDVENFQPYFEVAPKIAKAVAKGDFEKGILCCGTGMGMAITANKYRGVYAAVVESIYTARMSAVVNKANVLCMGGWVIAPEMGVEIVKEWLKTPFGQGFPDERVYFLDNAFSNVETIENKNFNKEKSV